VCCNQLQLELHLACQQLPGGEGWVLAVRLAFLEIRQFRKRVSFFNINFLSLIFLLFHLSSCVSVFYCSFLFHFVSPPVCVSVFVHAFVFVFPLYFSSICFFAIFVSLFLLPFHVFVHFRLPFIDLHLFAWNYQSSSNLCYLEAAAQDQPVKRAFDLM
jgi:hypothetical protein